MMNGLAVTMIAALLACNASVATAPTAQPAETPIPLTIPTTVTPTVVIPTLTPSPTPIALGGLSTTISYTLPLTVRHVTDTSATLFFELSAPSEGVLLYEPAEGSQRAVTLNPSDVTQQIVLEGLMPGTAYRARVGLGGGGTFKEPGFREQAWGPVSFHTQSATEPLRIGVIGDSGFGQQVTYDLATQMAALDLDFVLHTGDVVYSIEQNTNPYEAYALKYYLPFAPLLQTMPVYTVVGNHDVEQEAMYQGTPFIYHAFPSFVDARFSAPNTGGLNQWYAMAYGNIQFLMLDTQTFFNEPGRAEQTAWLSERLADARFAYSIPVFHVPPFSSGLHPHDGAALRTEWLPLFEASRVPLALSGHDHNYERLTAGGTTYIISGGGTTVIYDQSITLPESMFFIKKTHFVLLEIYSDRIDLQAVALGGEVLDQTTIPLSPR
jgi:predicted phosphodiesterase